MIKVSPSLIGSLFECPRCLWFHFNDGLKRPAGIFPSLPGGMDGVFKTYFDSYRKVGKLPPEIDGKVDGKLFSDAEQLEKWRTKRKELAVEFPEYDMVLNGLIDDLLVAPDGKFIPFDFKTRGYPLKADTHEHYQHQLDLYALMFEHHKHPVTEYGYLLFFYPKSYSKGNAEFVTELIKMDVDPNRALELLKKVYEIVSGNTPNAHSECQYCKYLELSNTLLLNYLDL